MKRWVVGRREGERGREGGRKREGGRERERGEREINWLLDTGSPGLFISLDSISISSYQVY